MDDLNSFPINIFDIAVIGVLLISALFAYARGFVHEVLSVGGWIGAIFATFYGFPYVKPYAHDLVLESAQEEPSAAILLAVDFSAGLVLFVLSLVILSYLTRSISRKVQSSALNALDRALGFLFGLVRGAVVVCLAFIGLELVLPQDDHPEWLTNAKSMELVRPGAAKLRTFLPDQEGTDPVAKAAEKARERTQNLLGASKAVRDIISPQPKSETTTKEGSYGQKERQDMERLIDTNQPPN